MWRGGGRFIAAVFPHLAPGQETHAFVHGRWGSRRNGTENPGKRRGCDEVKKRVESGIA